MVAGERHRSVQPGGRPPAPGALALVQAFINTHYDLEVDHGAEVLSTPGALAAWLTARAMIDGTWSRLKVCPGHDCGWAFYDGSRNQTGRWCSMSVCGGRAKARTHYQRRRRERAEGR